MSRFSKLLTIAVGAALLLGGFGCKNTAPAVGGKDTQRKTLEIWTVYDDVDALQKLVTAYRAERPYLQVNIRQLRAEELYDRLVEALAEDRGPDILSLNNRAIGKYVSKLAKMPGSIRDTTVRVVKGNFSTETIVNTQTKATVTLDQLDRQYLQVVRQDAVRGGAIYGLPLSMDTMAMYYNKDLLDRAGVPEPPKTWEEFQEAVRKLTKYDQSSGKIIQSGAAIGTGSNVPWSDDVLYVLFKQSNVPFVDRANRAIFNRRAADSGDETPAMDVLDFYTDFANPTRDTYTWNAEMGNALDSFVTGKVGFFFGYHFHNDMIKSRAPQLNYEVVPMLQLNSEVQANVAYYTLLTVTAKSKNPNEAWALITHLTNSAATKTYLDATGRLTALRAHIGAQSENIELAPFVSQLLIASSWYSGNNYEAAASAVSDMLREWLQNPPDPDRLLEFRQGILNRAASKINQTL